MVKCSDPAFWTPERRQQHAETMRSRLPIERNCINCGKKFQSNSYRTVRCEPCQELERELYAWRGRAKAYGISLDQLKQMYAECDGLCMICREEPSKRLKRVKRLDIDHSHEIGVIRGLLCNRCNIVLGKVGDSIEILRLMIKYLEEHANPEEVPAA